MNSKLVYFITFLAAAGVEFRRSKADSVAVAATAAVTVGADVAVAAGAVAAAAGAEGVGAPLQPATDKTANMRAMT